MRSAVLFIVFNRPSTTERVFEAIRAARPPRLYISADGPRRNRPTDPERCKRVKEIVSAIDWECEAYFNFRSENLGCKRAVSSGITWFFDNESEGIILEDDVLPVPSFFEFCDEMLEYYRDESAVSMVSGSNLISSEHPVEDSYFFTRYCHIWGWATWRRAWQHYELDMRSYPEWLAAGGLEEHCRDWAARLYWRRIFGATYRGEIDTWDYQWFFTCWKHRSLCAIPGNSLTLNIGFDGDATHTTGPVPHYVTQSTHSEMSFPLRHPHSIDIDLVAEKVIDKSVFGLSFLRRVLLAARWAMGR